MTDESFEDSRCKYRTFTKDYKIDKQVTKEEQVFIESNAKKHYQKEYSQWLPIQSLKEQREEWRPCPYFDQLNIAKLSRHSVYNYLMFLAFLPIKNALKPRELLVLDEGHLLEHEIVKFTCISISKRRWKRYIPDFEIIDHGYNDIGKWIESLIDLQAKMRRLAGDNGNTIHLRTVSSKTMVAH